MRILFVFLLVSLLNVLSATAQEKEIPVPLKTDTVPPVKQKLSGSSRYDSAMKAHSPRTAAIRSAMLPGLGQIYNKKYWKLPIVYGALGTCGGIFLYNLKNYRDTRFAYRVKYNMAYNRTDSALYPQIRNNLKPLDIESLRYYRNSFRRDIDYSVLFFILIWGLNVVDATVDAHLKSFDVSPELSLRVKPGYSDMAKTKGLSLLLKIGK
ncbi:MAG: hypothetical protein J0M10_01860 [Chitinophagales bacterium]|nr:hypothetical protein [Chitinophagales bacterium]